MLTAELEAQLLDDLIGDDDTTRPMKPWKLLYRASNDGYSDAAFHRLCDGHGPTVMLLLKVNADAASNNDDPTERRGAMILGGFTNIPWSSERAGARRKDVGAFLFSYSEQRDKLEKFTATSDDAVTAVPPRLSIGELRSIGFWYASVYVEKRPSFRSTTDRSRQFPGWALDGCQYGRYANCEEFEVYAV